MNSNPNCVVLDTKKLNPDHIITWCNRQFGSNAWNWISEFPNYNWRFYFNNPEDATMFRLRWTH